MERVSGRESETYNPSLYADDDTSKYKQTEAKENL